MITLTRSPLGRRASTIGLDSSTRRLTVETIRSMVCMSSASPVKRASMRCRLPWRSTHTSLGPLTMISVIVSSASSGSRMPRPSDSSTIWRMSRAARGAGEHRALAAEQLGHERLQPRAPLRRPELDQLGEVDLLQQLALEVADRRARGSATSPLLGRARRPPAGLAERAVLQAHVRALLRHGGLAVDLEAQAEVRAAGHDDWARRPRSSRAAPTPGCRIRVAARLARRDVVAVLGLERAGARPRRRRPAAGGAGGVLGVVGHGQGQVHLPHARARGAGSRAA